MSKMWKKASIVGAAALPLLAAACLRDSEHDVGSNSEAIFQARTIDTTYPEVVAVEDGDGSCTGTLLPGNLVVTASHCGFGVGSLTTIGVNDFVPGSQISKKVSVDFDGDPRTTGDRTSYDIASAYAVSTPTGGAIARWDLTVLALAVPADGAPWSTVYAAKGEPARHRILTSYRNGTAPSDLSGLVAHVPFNPLAKFDGAVDVQRVGLGYTDLVLLPDGGFADAHAPVTFDDAGNIASAGPLSYRFLAPGRTSGFEALDPAHPDHLANLNSTQASAADAYLVQGDSGGPLLVHPSLLGGAGFSATDEFVIGVLGVAEIPAPPAGHAPEATHGITFSDVRGKWIEDRLRRLLADRDGDGIPLEKDNCPNIANFDQANCNRDVEEARGEVRLGDVCDPVPCPGTVVNPVNVSTAPQVTCGSGHRLAGKFCFGGYERPYLDLRTVGSSPTSKLADVPARGYPVADVATHFRYASLPGDNTSRNPDNLVRARILDVEPTSLNGRIWRRMTFVEAGWGQPKTLSLGVDTPTMTWAYATDATNWAAGFWDAPTITGGCQFVGASPGHAGVCLNSEVWTYADTPLGANSANNYLYAPGSGNLAFRKRVVGYHAPNLPAKVTAVRPEFQGNFYGPGVGWQEVFRRPVVLTLPDPSWWSSVGPTVPYRRGEATILSALNNDILFIHSDGSAEPSGGQISGDLYNVLAEFETMPANGPTQRWIDLADAETREDRPLSVVARKQSNGTWKFDSVVTYYGGMILESEYGNPLRYGSVATLPATPIVYSPTDDALWTADTNTLSRHAAGTTSFVNLLPANADIKPANVKALAFDAERQAAWVLDYTATGIPRLLRFAKNEAGVWTGSVLSQGSSAGATSDVHYLHVMRDGRIMYARTNVAANTRTVGRFTYDFGVLSATVLTGTPNYTTNGGGSGVVSGAILARPLLDATGYHQMVAGEESPVTTAARTASGARGKGVGSGKPAPKEGAYATTGAAAPGESAPPDSVLW